jgi:hypothetical protein
MTTILTLFNQLLETIPGQARGTIGTCITSGQFRQYLAAVDLGNPPFVASNIPYSPYNAVNIGWNCEFVRYGDQLWVFAMGQLGFGAAQWPAQWALCAGYKLTP